MAQLWDLSGLNAKTKSSPDMEVTLWQKLAANCVCNPLTALWAVPNGELSKHPDFSSLRKSVVAEISEVAQIMNPSLADRLNPGALDRFVEQVIKDNLENKSSMYRDVVNGRKTEIENLNGYVVRKGAELEIPTLANLELMERIQEISSDAHHS